MLESSEVLNDLKSPPGNRLEPLEGDRKGQHSIRINKQWRVCFRWAEDGPEDVVIDHVIDHGQALLIRRQCKQSDHGQAKLNSCSAEKHRKLGHPFKIVLRIIPK